MTTEADADIEPQDDIELNDDTIAGADAGTEGEGADPDLAPAEPEKPKSDWVQKRIDELTAQRYQERQRAEKAERDLAAMRAFNEARGDAPQSGDAPKTYTQADIEAEAARIADKRLAEEAGARRQKEFTDRCNTVFEDGQKAFSATFGKSVANLQMAGVLSADDVSFVESALETENPAAVLNHLGQNPDEAQRIASMTAPARAVAMDRLARDLSKAPAPTPLSKAPAPISPVSGDRAKGSVDLYSDDLSDADFFAERERRWKAKNA